MIQYTEQDRKDWERYKRGILRTKEDIPEDQILLAEAFKGQNKRRELRGFRIIKEYKEDES